MTLFTSRVSQNGLDQVAVINPDISVAQHTGSFIYLFFFTEEKAVLRQVIFQGGCLLRSDSMTQAASFLCRLHGGLPQGPSPCQRKGKLEAVRWLRSDMLLPLVTCPKLTSREAGNVTFPNIWKEENKIRFDGKIALSLPLQISCFPSFKNKLKAITGGKCVSLLGEYPIRNMKAP